MRVRPDQLPYLLATIMLLGLLWQVVPDNRPLPESPPRQEGVSPSAGGGERVRLHEPLHPLPAATSLDPGIVALGRRLFHDPRLSADGRLACASCHPLDQGGADGLPYSTGGDGNPNDVNTPSVLTAALNFRQYWDGRFATLEEQVADSITNPLQMAATWPQVVARLGQDPALKRSFQQHFPDGLSEASVKRAIGDFERSLPQPSRFDRWLRGDHAAISSDELKGYELFKAYGCAGCHQGVNVGGNLFQRLGIMTNYYGQGHPPGKADLGRFNITHQEEDLHVFKVPSLRNVARTAPYFHDASSDRLEDAVIKMGRYQLGIDIPSGDAALIAGFLDTLDSGPLP